MSLFDRDPALLQPILDFQQELKRAGFQPPVFCTAETFPILLAGIPALRIIPGLSGFQDMGKEYFTTIPYCRDTDSVNAAQAHLKDVFHYSDLEGLTAFSRENLDLHRQYQDFESFWEGRPSFDLNELPPEAQQVFTACSDFARQFQSIVGRRGFIAWDISENLGHLRAAHACHLISKQEYTQLAEYWVTQASAFRSFQQYAVDLLCGAAFWAFRMGCELEEIIDYVNLNIRVLRQLMNSKDAWCGRMWWSQPGAKRLRLSPPRAAHPAAGLGWPARLSGLRPHHGRRQACWLLLPGDPRRRPPRQRLALFRRGRGRGLPLRRQPHQHLPPEHHLQLRPGDPPPPQRPRWLRLRPGRERDLPRRYLILTARQKGCFRHD